MIADEQLRLLRCSFLSHVQNMKLIHFLRNGLDVCLKNNFVIFLLQECVQNICNFMTGWRCCSWQFSDQVTTEEHREAGVVYIQLSSIWCRRQFSCTEESKPASEIRAIWSVFCMAARFYKTN